MNFSQGKMYSVLVSDSNAVYSAVSVMISLIFTVINVIGIGVVAVCINWQLCVILMNPYPFIVYINRKFRKMIKENAVSNLDDVTKNHLACKLRKLAENKIIILISHNIDDYKICDEVYKIENGYLKS